MSRLWLSPHGAVVLGIDPGETSGWGIAAPQAQTGRPPACVLAGHGVATTAREIDAAVSLAHDTALDLGLPFYVAGETWTSGHMPALAYGGLREAWGRWSQAIDRSPELELFGGDTPPVVVRVVCQTWRADLGLRPVLDATVLQVPAKERSRAAWKRSAVLAVRARFGLAVSDDEAEGICLAVWGAHSQVVADHIASPKPKRRRTA